MFLKNKREKALIEEKKMYLYQHSSFFVAWGTDTIHNCLALINRLLRRHHISKSTFDQVRHIEILVCNSKNSKIMSYNSCICSSSHGALFIYQTFEETKLIIDFDPQAISKLWNATIFFFWIGKKKKKRAVLLCRAISSPFLVEWWLFYRVVCRNETKFRSLCKLGLIFYYYYYFFKTKVNQTECRLLLNKSNSFDKLVSFIHKIK